MGGMFSVINNDVATKENGKGLPRVGHLYVHLYLLLVKLIPREACARSQHPPSRGTRVLVDKSFMMTSQSHCGLQRNSAVCYCTVIQRRCRTVTKQYRLV